ncbi:DUF4259 domain-containing protein [Streptomyces sp. JNUCC 64]
MGTWDIGPFENDAAADFGSDVDATARDEREALLRAKLVRVARTPVSEFLDSWYGEVAVAAAALIAAGCPGGEPVRTSYGPEEALPVFADDLRPLAVEALDRVLAGESELAELWDETSSGPQWREGVSRLRLVLAPEARDAPEPGAREAAPSGR